MRWLEENTVFFGVTKAPSFDSTGDFQTKPGKRPPSYYSFIKTFIRECAAEAFAKTFPAVGYDHHSKAYYGSTGAYRAGQGLENGTPEACYNTFLKNPDPINNQSVSFFGGTSNWKGASRIQRGGYVARMIFKTTINTLRLFSEFVLCFLETLARRWLEHCRDERRGAGMAKQLAAGFGMILSGLLYYGLKLSLSVLRLVTAPSESMKAEKELGKTIHPIVGYVFAGISGFLSLVAYAALAVFALPVALPVMVKVFGAKVIGAISQLVTTIKHAFPHALPALAAGIAFIGMLITKLFAKFKSQKVEEKGTAVAMNFFSGRLRGADGAGASVNTTPPSLSGTHNPAL